MYDEYPPKAWPQCSGWFSDPNWSDERRRCHFIAHFKCKVCSQPICKAHMHIRSVANLQSGEEFTVLLCDACVKILEEEHRL